MSITRSRVGVVGKDFWAPLNSATAGFHNSIYRGKDITAYLTDGSIWARISGSSPHSLFEDLFVGDYITTGGHSYAICDFDYYIRCGSVDITAHHLIMMPTGNMDIPAGTALYGVGGTLTLIGDESATGKKWNATSAAPSTHTTAGGYKFSRMRTVIMKAANTIVINAFGSQHVLPITELYYNPSSASDSGLASGWGWFDKDSQSDANSKSICDLCNEVMVYGAPVWGQGSAYTNVGYEVGIDKKQLAIFRLCPSFANIRAYWWLRSVYSATYAANVIHNGFATNDGSASSFGVRPRFLLVG